eukprot:TRINITY_DN112259_c0_g1_i1.p1 TRINITY_DN112259_c0_g1~~TRINITY_DN112259_c0_g1_i1.p1  ORF type:complete len:321 (-),score=18.31 TRINITY_DN112259_c0_g1_i1:28-990(-)
MGASSEVVSFGFGVGVCAMITTCLWLVSVHHVPYCDSAFDELEWQPKRECRRCDRLGYCINGIFVSCGSGDNSSLVTPDTATFVKYKHRCTPSIPLSILGDLAMDKINRRLAEEMCSEVRLDFAWSLDPESIRAIIREDPELQAGIAAMQNSSSYDEFSRSATMDTLVEYTMGTLYQYPSDYNLRELSGGNVALLRFPVQVPLLCTLRFAALQFVSYYFVIVPAVALLSCFVWFCNKQQQDQQNIQTMVEYIIEVLRCLDEDSIQVAEVHGSLVSAGPHIPSAVIQRLWPKVCDKVVKTPNVRQLYDDDGQESWALMEAF